MIRRTGTILVVTATYTQRITFYSDHTADHYDSGTSAFATTLKAYPKAWQIVQANG